MPSLGHVSRYSPYSPPLRGLTLNPARPRPRLVRTAPSQVRTSAAPTAGAPRQGALGEGVYVGVADVPLSYTLEQPHLGLEAARGGQVRDGVFWAEGQ